jgi:DNA-binding IclR family transcriptional regulator
MVTFVGRETQKMTRKRSSARSSGIKTLYTSFDIVETLAELDRCTVSELADRTEYTVSTVYEHLVTLQDLGYVLKEDDKTYRLSTRFLELGTRVRTSRLEEHRIRSTITSLAAETDDVVWFHVEEHGMAVNLYKAVGARGIQTYGRVGKQVHLHSSAGGKAILAEFPDDRIEAVLAEHGLPAYTPSTITDREAFFDEIERVRERGVAHCDCETITDVRAVGAAVLLDESSGTVGAITVGGPATRLDGDYYERELPDLLRQHANELELKLKFE